MTLDEHPFVVLAEGLIKKNAEAKAWDTKTQRQAPQISRLFARLILEQGVVEFEDIHQRRLGDLDDLFGAVAKSYGRSPRDNHRTLDQLRAIGAAKPPSERGLVAGTVNRHFSFLGQVLAHIRSRGHKLDRDIDKTLMRRKPTERGRAKRGLLTDADASGAAGITRKPPPPAPRPRRGAAPARRRPPRAGGSTWPHRRRPSPAIAHARRAR